MNNDKKARSVITRLGVFHVRRLSARLRGLSCCEQDTVSLWCTDGLCRGAADLKRTQWSPIHKLRPTQNMNPEGDYEFCWTQYKARRNTYVVEENLSQVSIPSRRPHRHSTPRSQKASLSFVFALNPVVVLCGA